jgi:hypothetical protein
VHQHRLAGHQVEAALGERQPFRYALDEPHPATQAALTRTIAGALDPCGFALDADDLGIGGQQRRETQRPVALTRTHVESGTHLVESQPSRQQAQPVVVEPEVPLVVEVGSGVAIVGRAHRIYGRCSSVCDGAG